MATFQGTTSSEINLETQSNPGDLIDTVLDATVIALIAAGFVTLALNTIARL